MKKKINKKLILKFKEFFSKYFYSHNNKKQNLLMIDKNLEAKLKNLLETVTLNNIFFYFFLPRS